jgi:hypothetical protein
MLKQAILAQFLGKTEVKLVNFDSLYHFFIKKDL